jgi:hypothetical protein
VHQARQCSQSATVDEFHLIELHYHLDVVCKRIPHVCVQGEYFFSGNDATLTLDD